MKAINQDNKYAPGFRLKGHFLLSNGHPEQAVIAFYQSNTLEKDITSFSGDNKAIFYFFLFFLLDSVHVIKIST